MVQMAGGKKPTLHVPAEVVSRRSHLDSISSRFGKSTTYDPGGALRAWV